MTDAADRLVALCHRDVADVVEARRTLAANPAWREEATRHALRFLEEVVILATCERLELYGVTRVGRGAVLPDRVPAAALGPARRLEGPAVVHHLVRVAAGLESRMVGETHIQGQVVQAARRAESSGSSGPVLRSLFATAARAGRRARRETPLGRMATCFVTAAVERLAQLDLERANVVILGSGVIAHELTTALRARGAGSVTIVTRHPRAWSAHPGIERVAVVSPGELSMLLPAADALVGATSSSRALVGSTDIAPRSRPLLVVDLGVPPNVDPDVARIAGVCRCGLEHFEGPRHAALVLAEAEAIVAGEAERCVARLRRTRRRVVA